MNTAEDLFCELCQCCTADLLSVDCKQTFVALHSCFQAIPHSAPGCEPAAGSNGKSSNRLHHSTRTINEHSEASHKLAPRLGVEICREMIMQ